tara:strand:+ start:1131 stop:1304 length:174 start_codon:yes stop_codon:yes gene_type:complete
MNPNNFVGKLVKISDKIGVIAECNYKDKDDMWELSVVMHDGETFISYPSLIHRFLIN